MKFKVFCSANYLGEFNEANLFTKNEIIAQGSLIALAEGNYSVKNIMVRKNGDVVLEVNK